MEDIVLELLREINGKVDRIQQDIAILKIEDANIKNNVNILKEDHDSVESRLEKIERNLIDKGEFKNLKDRVILLEESPHKEAVEKVTFVKKAIMAGIAALITGVVIYLGSVLWKIIVNMDYLIEAVEKLKGGLL